MILLVFFSLLWNVSLGESIAETSKAETSKAEVMDIQEDMIMDDILELPVVEDVMKNEDIEESTAVKYAGHLLNITINDYNVNVKMSGGKLSCLDETGSYRLIIDLKDKSDDRVAIVEDIKNKRYVEMKYSDVSGIIKLKRMFMKGSGESKEGVKITPTNKKGSVADFETLKYVSMFNGSALHGEFSKKAQSSLKGVDFAGLIKFIADLDFSALGIASDISSDLVKQFLEKSENYGLLLKLTIFGKDKVGKDLYRFNGMKSVELSDADFKVGPEAEKMKLDALLNELF